MTPAAQRRFFAVWGRLVACLPGEHSETLRHHLIGLHSDNYGQSIHDLTDNQLADLTAKVEALTTTNEGAF